MSNKSNSPQSLHVVAQYLKDLSFENPGQGSLSRLQGVNPEININVQVNTAKNSKEPTTHYVDVTIKAISKIKESPLFILDATYTGVFDIAGFDEDLEEQIINIQCPALLFPFIRRIIGEKTVDGGYPPLYLDPIDFHGIYMQKKLQKSPKNNQNDKIQVSNLTDDDDDSENVKSVFN